MMTAFRFWLGLLLGTSLLARPAVAQWWTAPPAATDTSRIFSYVEQMPALPGGGGNLALVKTVQRLVQLPARGARAGKVEGRVYVRVVIGRERRGPASNYHANP